MDRKLKFKIGDRVTGVGIDRGFDVDGESGVIILCTDGFLDYNWYRVYFDRKFSNRLHSLNGKCRDVDEANLVYEDQEKAKEALKRRELARQTHKDVDPFGEEMWEGIKNFKEFKSGLSGI